MLRTPKVKDNIPILPLQGRITFFLLFVIYLIFFFFLGGGVLSKPQYVEISIPKPFFLQGGRHFEDGRLVRLFLPGCGMWEFPKVGV